jgi:organic radical activating enzyme
VSQPPNGVRAHDAPIDEPLVRATKVLSIMPTFRCTAACTNCGTFSSPAERTTLDREAMLAAIKEAKQLGFAVVVFTGGEATLQRRDLLAGISYATELGLPTRVVSNAYWARSPQKAAKVLDELVGAGLSEINYSTGDEHIRFVPIERVAIASVAAIERQLPVHVMVELRSTRAVTREVLLARPELDVLDEEQRKLLHVAESPWMPIEPDQIEQYPAGVAVDQTNIASRAGCDSILRTYTVQSDGRVASCCGLGMRVIDDLNVTTVAEPGFLRRAIETSESDMLKLWIHTLGPDRILQWAAEKDPSIRWEGQYAHHCQTCHRLYRDPKVRAVIERHGAEMMPVVAQTLWLDQYFAPDILHRASRPHAGLDMTR